MMNNLPLSNYIKRHETILINYINQLSLPAKRLSDAIEYSLFPGGKRIRPLLVYLSGELANAPIEALDSIAAAIELAHCFSLVHDDLPAMDNDDYRRGKLSCHKAFDEATAILAGDGMLALAIELLLQELQKTLSPTQVIDITQTLLKAVGVHGMLSGQCLDLTELTTPIQEERLRQIHRLKTGRVIEACVECAILAGSCTQNEALSLRTFATELGLFFQIQDDYLDSYIPQALGKGRASDTANQKTTYATLFSQKKLEEMILGHIRQLDKTLDCFQGKAKSLKYFTQNLVKINLESVD